MLELLKANNVEINLGLIAKEITDEGIICVDNDGNTREFSVLQASLGSHRS